MPREDSREQSIREQKHLRSWVELLLMQAQARNWYGTVTIVIEDGIIKRMEEKRSHLPPPILSGNPA